MSASSELSIDFKGTQEEFDALLAKLKEIENPKTVSFTRNPHYPFWVEGHRIYADNGPCRNIWGADYLDPEPDMYLELAKTVPNAAFEVNSKRVYEVGGGGCETFLSVSFKNRKLTFKLLARVDTFSLASLGSWNNTQDVEPVTAVVVGRTKFHANHEELKDYFEIYDVEFTDEITPDVNYVICNYPAAAKKMIAQAQALNIPIISEAKAIRMFGDTYDFEDANAVVQDMTFEDFASIYHLVEDVTPDVFELAKKDEESFIINCDDHISLEGPWSETTYILNERNEFEKQS